MPLARRPISLRFLRNLSVVRNAVLTRSLLLLPFAFTPSCDFFCLFVIEVYSIRFSSEDELNVPFTQTLEANELRGEVAH